MPRPPRLEGELVRGSVEVPDIRGEAAGGAHEPVRRVATLGGLPGARGEVEATGPEAGATAEANGARKHWSQCGGVASSEAAGTGAMSRPLCYKTRKLSARIQISIDSRKF